jgi:hypothetical protein
MTQDNSIIEKTKKFLNLEETDISTSELHNQLYNYRKQIHPDLVTEANKSLANEKFIEASDLLTKLSDYISSLSLTTPGAKEIQTNSINPDLLLSRQNEIQKDKIIADLRQDLELANYEISKLKESVKKSTSLTLKTNTDLLEKLYSVKLPSAIGLGSLTILSGLFLLLNKIETISLLISKYSPLDENSSKNSIFVIFALTCFLSLRTYINKRSVFNWSIKVTSNKFINKFLYIAVLPQDKGKFTENQVYEFIERELIGVPPFFKLIKWLYSPIYSENSVSYLKDIFISNLINRRLILIQSAANLNRQFKIISSEWEESYYENDLEND